jgi:hypothetical protein
MVTMPHKLIFALLLALGAAAFAYTSPALAARHPRIDDADIGKPHSFILEYGQDSYEETTALASGRDVATFFSLGYNINQRLQARGTWYNNELSGVDVLFNPLFSDLDNADGWGVEFRMMLDHTLPVLPATPDAKFTPGNSFTVAVGFSSLGLEAPGIDDELHRFHGRLMYSTDFSQELHAHTVFSTEHYTSDTKRGNSTSLGLGADYDLFAWDGGLLQLSANGLIDIYSMRKPSFDTGRVTRFDAGLRIKLGDSFGGYAGYEVVNDSLSDRNGQGIFYGITYTPDLSFATRAKPPAAPEAPAEGAAPPAEGGEAQPPAEGAPPEAAPAEEGKGTSSAPRDRSPLLPPVDIIGPSTPPPAQTPVIISQSDTSGPVPTTTARISRPPAIENPWELLPIGYDFHGPRAETTEAVASLESEPSDVTTAAKDLHLHKTASGNFSVYSNAE